MMGVQPAPTAQRCLGISESVPNSSRMRGFVKPSISARAAKSSGRAMRSQAPTGGNRLATIRCAGLQSIGAVGIDERSIKLPALRVQVLPDGVQVPDVAAQHALERTATIEHRRGIWR